MPDGQLAARAFDEQRRPHQADDDGVGAAFGAAVLAAWPDPRGQALTACLSGGGGVDKAVA